MDNAIELVGQVKKIVADYTEKLPSIKQSIDVRVDGNTILIDFLNPIGDHRDTLSQKITDWHNEGHYKIDLGFNGG